jgi:hypothetical protein
MHMTPANTIITRLAGWLAAQSFSPPLREIALAPATPSAYPHLLLSASGEQFGPTPQDATLSLRLRLAHASGRPDDALSGLRELAHSLRSALLSSGNAAGGAQALSCPALHYGVHEGAEPVVAWAELEVELKYILQ